MPVHDLRLRLAREEDYEDIIRMSRMHLGTSVYRDLSISDARISAVCTSLLHGPATEGIIILAVTPEDMPVGCIIGSVQQPTFSTERFSIELLWWVDIDYRWTRVALDLQKAYEYWAEHVAKVNSIGLALFEDENTPALSRLYARWGYMPHERIYMKRL